MDQKLLNSTGECLISLIKTGNIGKNFRTMFHNSWGANNVGLNCTSNSLTSEVAVIIICLFGYRRKVEENFF